MASNSASLHLFLWTVFVLVSTVYSYNDTDEDIQAQIIALDQFIAASTTKQPGPPPAFNASAFPNFTVFQDIGDKSKKKLQTAAICSACNVGIGFIMFKVRDTNTQEAELRRNLIFVCVFFKVALPPHVCSGLLDRYSPTIYFIIKNRPALTSKTFCGVMLQSLGCVTNDPLLEWEVEIPKLRNVSFYANLEGGHVDHVRSLRASRIKIAQMTDIHIDPLYEIGSNAECENKILCCRTTDGKPTDKSLQAGAFGDGRNCDSKVSTLELALKDMSERHSDMELFYMTGDIIPHNIWSTTQEDNTQIIQTNAKLILKYFPKMKIIPVLGNHETHPVNFYSPHGVPENISTTWIYNVTYDAYKQWIPKDQKDVYLQHGYFAVKIKPKFRVLAINSNFCYGFNVWQMYENRDPGNQLKWLIKELDKSERLKETVHIVGHVPPTHDDCSRVWSKNFYDIMLRYHHIIKGQFYGHTHYDELKVLFNKGQAINTLWIAPSLTPFEIHNYEYRIYYADPADYQIMDHETWTFDLKEANASPDTSPTWYRLYIATEDYGIKDLTPTSLATFIDSMAKDDALFQQFYQHYNKILHVEDRIPCGKFCKQDLLCGFVKSYYGDERECVRFYVPDESAFIGIPTDVPN